MCEARLAAGKERITISVARLNGNEGEQGADWRLKKGDRERVQVLPVRMRLNWCANQD